LAVEPPESAMRVLGCAGYGREFVGTPEGLAEHLMYPPTRQYSGRYYWRPDLLKINLWIVLTKASLQ